MKSLFLSFCLGVVIAGHTQELSSSSTAVIATGAYSNSFTDAFSQLNNPAALANLPHFSAGVFAEKKFLLNELNRYTGVAALPVGKAGLGLSIQHFGYSEYNESGATMAYGKALGKVSIGIQCSYTRVSTAGYGSDAALSYGAGSLWQVTEKLFTSFYVVNPVGGRFGKQSREKLPAVYKTGVGYSPAEKLLLYTEFIKEEDKPVAVHAGMQYIIAGNFFTKLGMVSAAASPYFGAGWKWKNLRADVLIQYHSILGISPGLQFIFYSPTSRSHE